MTEVEHAPAPPPGGAGAPYNIPDDREPVGTGLLPTTWGASRGALVDALGLAYGRIMDDRARNYLAWHQTIQVVTKSIQDEYASVGLEAAPFDEDILWSRVALPFPATDPTQHMRLVMALLTDYQERFAKHIRYRLKNNANVHLEITGPTGMAKSSCALSIINWIRTIDPDNLVRHLSIDVTELPSKLNKLERGESVVQDEYVQTSGEGARTAKSLFENLEDTLRGSQVNLIVLSPRLQEHATMQAMLELILWNPEKKYSAFLVWLKGVPVGVIAIPWAPQPIWDAYGPWKANNVQRTLQGQFKDTSYIAKLAMSAFDDKRLVEYLLHLSNKPKKGDFKTALEFFMPQMVSGAQSDRMVAFIHDVCYNYESIASKLPEWFGVTPTQGLEAVARRCYKE